MRKTLAVLGITLLCLTAVAFAQDTETTQEEIDELKEDIKDLEKRVMKNERKTALDRINFIGDFRFEVNSIRLDLRRLLQRHAAAADAGRHPVLLRRHRHAARRRPKTSAASSPRTTPTTSTTSTTSSPSTGSRRSWARSRPRCSRRSWAAPAPTPTPRATTTRTTSSTPTASVCRWTPRCPRTSTSPAASRCTRPGATPPASRSSTAQPDLDQHRRHHGVGAQLRHPAGRARLLHLERRPSSTSRSVVVPPPAARRSTSARTSPAAARPLGSVINFQFDGVTVGWHISDKITMRLCYGVGFESGFGNGEVAQAARRPAQGRLVPRSQLGHLEHRGHVHPDDHRRAPSTSPTVSTAWSSCRSTR